MSLFLNKSKFNSAAVSWEFVSSAMANFARACKYLRKIGFSYSSQLRKEKIFNYEFVKLCDKFHQDLTLIFFKQIQQWIDDFAAANPSLATKNVVGTSHEGRTFSAITVLFRDIDHIA